MNCDQIRMEDAAFISCGQKSSFAPAYIYWLLSSALDIFSIYELILEIPGHLLLRLIILFQSQSIPQSVMRLNHSPVPVRTRLHAHV